MTEQPVTKPPAGDTITISGGALKVPDQPVIPYVEGDGKGKPEADCFIGLEGYDDDDLTAFGKKGKPAIQCTDCDPACDLDGVSTPNGSCTFSIAIRINDAGDPACTPSPLKTAKAKAKTKGTKIDFSSSAPPPLDGSSATSTFVDFPVLVKAKKKGDKPGTGKLQVLAKKAEKPVAAAPSKEEQKAKADAKKAREKAAKEAKAAKAAARKAAKKTGGTTTAKK